MVSNQSGEVPEVDLRVRVAKGEDGVLVLLVEQLEPEIELVPAARGVELQQPGVLRARRRRECRTREALRIAGGRGTRGLGDRV